MPIASIGGLVSGLDTAGLIDKFMSIEAAPQDRLRAQVSKQQGLQNIIQGLNTKAALLGSKANDLAKASTWQAATSTSSNPAVTVTAGATAAATQLSVSVTSVARTQQLGFTDSAAMGDKVTGATNSVKLAFVGRDPITVVTTDGTLAGLVSAINKSNAGVKATAIKSGEGYRLLVESTATGAAQNFDLTAEDGSALLGGRQVRAGTDASLDLGAGITVTSATNTFADLAPGVSLTLASNAAVGSTADVAVGRDSTKLSTAVKDLVDSMNSLLSDIDTQTAYNSTTKTSGPLSSDFGVRSLRNAVQSAVFGTDGRSLAEIGIQTDRTGKIVLDEAKLTAALAADPEGVAARFTTATPATDTRPATVDGFAARLAAVAKSASDPFTGTLTAALSSSRSNVTRLQKDVDGWDIRLELRRASLSRQYTALETALSQSQNQGNWLSGQIAKLG